MTDSAPIILTATMGKAEQRWATALRARLFPAERNHLPAHITLFHHLPGTQAAHVVGEVKRICAEHAPPAAHIDRLLPLDRGVALHIDSPALLAIREELAERFFGLLSPQDEGVPRLHITVQNKVDARTARATLAELGGEFEPRAIAITGIAAHHYRGGPWEEIGAWRFRGRD